MVEDGDPVPAALLNEVEVPADLRFVWEAFWRLHTERPIGFGGTGPIPHSAVMAAADRLGMASDEADWFAGLVAKMDGTYLAWAAKQRPKRDG